MKELGMETTVTEHLVLVVEDDDVQRMTLAAALEAAGFTVISVSNAFEAHLKFNKNVAAIVTDYNMPHMSGAQLTEEIRQIDEFVPIILITAAADISVAFDSIKSGANELLVKDSTSQYLVAIPHLLKRTILKAEQQRDLALKLRKAEGQSMLVRRALHAIKDAMAIVDSTASVLFMNQAMESLIQSTFNSSPDSASFVNLMNRLITKDILLMKDAAAFSLEAVLLKVKKSKRCGALVELDGMVFQCTFEAIEEGKFAVFLSQSAEIANQIEELRKIIRFSPVAMIAVNSSGKLILTNAAANTLLEIDEFESGRYDIGQFVDYDSATHMQFVRSYLEQATVRPMGNKRDVHLVTLNQRRIPVEVTLNSISFNDQKVAIASVVDLRERKRLEAEIIRTSTINERIFEHANYPIVLLECSGNILQANKAFTQLTGLDCNKSGMSKKANILDVIDATEVEIRIGQSLDSVSNRIAEFIFNSIREEEKYQQHWTWKSTTHNEYKVRMTLSKIPMPGASEKAYVLIAHDSTQEIRDKEYIQHLAHHDSLTGLPNRLLFLDRLEVALTRARRNHSSVGVINIDLDGFKAANDTFGHLLGDEVLKEVARRLSEYIRKSDTACRMGGDEFVLLLEDIEQEYLTLKEFMNNLVQKLAEPYVIHSRTIKLSASIGIAIGPENGETVDELLRNADSAMYQSKRNGKNQFSQFNNISPAG